VDGVVSHFYSVGYHISENDKAIRTIIDLGANIGSETFKFFIHYPEARIFAVEASASNFSLLLRTFQDIPNVTVINKAIWCNDDDISLYSRSEDPQSFFVSSPDAMGSADPIGKVETITMNGLVSHYSISEIDILKIDIEGAERYLFSENLEWLNSVNCMIFEIPDTDAPYTTQMIFKRLSEFNLSFRSFICSECLVLIKSTVNWNLKSINGYLTSRDRSLQK